MRIVSGSLKGRRFSPPKNFKARPTTDTAREALFNVLAHSMDINELKVLDLFSGTGAMSYEFASRGCLNVTSVEKNFHHQMFIQQCISEFHMQDVIHSLKADVFSYLNHAPKKTFDLVFADPPFDMKNFEAVAGAVIEAGIIVDGGLFILEHGPQRDYSNHAGVEQIRKYGKVHFTFFRV
jgi:16S rRNA (guanine(966)-N(2))-methyltransferase RsmD